MNQVAHTILEQLGGAGRLTAMVGAHSFMAGDDSLTFKFRARAANGSNCVAIELATDDTYRVSFYAIRGHKISGKGQLSGVYADALRGTVEGETGLALGL